MIKAVFLDFYGTLVHEDGEVIKIIVKRIKDTATAYREDDIGGYWWNSFQQLFVNSYGEAFQTQRELEKKSLKDTLEHFKSTESIEALSELMFANWVRPPAFEDSKEFFDKCQVSIYIVSNIDKSDIVKAIEYHGYKPAKLFTSEDARSYKPRKELFELALKETGLTSEEVIHIGDSLSNDIIGASNAGIKSIWINRSSREIPEGVIAVNNLLELFDTKYFKGIQSGLAC